MRRFFSLEPYTSARERARARMIYGISMVVLVTYTLYALFVPQWTINDVTMPLLQAIVAVGTVNATMLLFFSLYLFSGAAIFFTRQGRLNAGSVSVTLLWYFSGVILSLYALPDVNDSGLAMLMFVLLMALLYLERGLYVGFPVMLATIYGALILRTVEQGEFEFLQFAASLVVTLNLTGGCVLLYMFLYFFRLSIREEVTEAVEERVVGGQILSQVTQLVAQRATTATLLKGIVGLIVDSFPLVDQARIYIMDDQGVQAELAVDTGVDVQKQEQKTYVFVGSAALAGQVLESGDSKVVLHNDTNTTETAFPLRIGSRVVGALEMQTHETDFFTSSNVVSSFKSLTDALALAIDNVRQFERAESRLRENEQLVEQTRSVLREVERLNQRLISETWTDYLSNMNEQPGLSIDFDKNDVQSLDDWTETLREAAEINQLVQNQEGERQIVAIPLRVRGQVIGAMEFELDAQETFTPEQFDLMQDVSERVGLAAENTRLVLESQRIAQREAVVNQISTRLQATNNVQTALVEAARGLREALQADKISIRLGTPPGKEQNGNKIL